MEPFDESALPLAPQADGCCESHEGQSNSFSCVTNSIDQSTDC